jgi:hypothetical protein
MKLNSSWRLPVPSVEFVTIIRNFARPSLVSAAAANVPAADWPHWYRYSGASGDKYATRDPGRLHASHWLLLNKMAEIEVPTGEFPDLDLHGAGLHWIPAGGRLPLHVDAQRHPLRPWRRTRTAILYLTACRGGELVLYDPGGKPIDRITPEPGILVMFPDGIPHEVSEVVEGDRVSLALFFWRRLDSSEQGEPLSPSATWL